MSNREKSRRAPGGAVQRTVDSRALGCRSPDFNAVLKNLEGDRVHGDWPKTGALSSRSKVFLSRNDLVAASRQLFFDRPTKIGGRPLWRAIPSAGRQRVGRPSFVMGTIILSSCGNDKRMSFEETFSHDGN
jgi:hypothetical protein